MVQVHPNSRNVIPGRVKFSIDLRNATDALCDAMDADIRATAREAQRRQRPAHRDRAGVALPGTALPCRLCATRSARAAKKLGYSNMPRRVRRRARRRLHGQAGPGRHDLHPVQGRHQPQRDRGRQARTHHRRVQRAAARDAGARGLAHLRPALFHAYVGVAQLVGPPDLIASHTLALQRARELGDQPAINTLQALGTPPWTDPRSFGKLRRILRGYEAQRTDPGPGLRRATDYAGAQDQAAYEAGEDFSFLKFVGFKGDGMLWQLDLPGQRTRLQLPVFLVQGEEDLLTPPAVTRAWFDRIEAPSKKLVTVPRAGHDPNGPLLEVQYRLLRDEVIPLTR
jgi:hypothetical protein